MARITITLQKEEREALGLLAQNEYRDPRAQAALLIRSELQRQGYLMAEYQPQEVGTHDQTTR